MNACICKRSGSGMVHHGRIVLAGLLRVAGAGRVHDLVCRAWIDFTGVYPDFFVRGESVVASNCEFGGRVGEVVVPYVDMCPDFVQGRAVPLVPPIV